MIKIVLNTMQSNRYFLSDEGSSVLKIWSVVTYGTTSSNNQIMACIAMMNGLTFIGAAKVIRKSNISFFRFKIIEKKEGSL